MIIFIATYAIQCQIMVITENWDNGRQLAGYTHTIFSKLWKLTLTLSPISKRSFQSGLLDICKVWGFLFWGNWQKFFVFPNISFFTSWQLYWITKCPAKCCPMAAFILVRGVSTDVRRPCNCMIWSLVAQASDSTVFTISRHFHIFIHFLIQTRVC
jgi:hypothetical protein